jgi:hypothetical protein
VKKPQNSLGFERGILFVPGRVIGKVGRVVIDVGHVEFVKLQRLVLGLIFNGVFRTDRSCSGLDEDK